MKRLVLLALFSLPAFGQQEITSDALQEVHLSPRKNLVETGLTFSSMNSGSTFGTVSINREVAHWLTMGVRGMVPLGMYDDEEIFGAQALLRINVLNEENVIYGEGQLTQGFYDDRFETHYFGMAGVTAGYSRKFTNGMSLGASLGIDYSSSRITDGLFIAESSTLYSKLGIVGGYFF